MVAVIKTGYSLRRTFLYNEYKVSEGRAVLLAAENYPMEMGAMTAAHRLNMLIKQAEKNPQVARNSVHISLNFAPGEIISPDKMTAIACQYMQAIGFADQPYLVYQHNDAGHPHLHIVTVKVDADGNRIETQNIGKTLSEQARKDIEKRYKLVPAESHRRDIFRLKPVVSKGEYGQTDTKRAIGNVLEYVLERYNYSTLPGLNALLSLYNIRAEQGSEDSRLRKYKGLQYRLLGPDGKPVGVPIKASLFHNRPTLAFLGKRFTRNQKQRDTLADLLRGRIDLAIRTARGRQTFKNLLKRQGIDLVARYTDQGRLYGITYIDHRNKSVFNGSELGKTFSAAAIAPLLAVKQFPSLKARDPNQYAHPPAPLQAPETGRDKSLWELLTEPMQGADYLPYHLRNGRKKKRKKRPNNLNP